MRIASQWGVKDKCVEWTRVRADFGNGYRMNSWVNSDNDQSAFLMNN